MHWPFFIGNERVGWLRADHAARLARWPKIFSIENDRVALTSTLRAPEARSAALGEAIVTLAADGVVSGWRDERYAIRNRFDDPPLAFIERAAARFFGVLTYAVHLNGIAHDGRLWLARRSASKAIDPGRLDNLVGGGIAWSRGIVETLVKECWEESGIAPALATRAQAGRELRILREVAEGVQAEQIFVYDLALPPGFVPRNQDGEVSEHCLFGVDQVLAAMKADALTLDATLVTLDWLLRSGRVREAELDWIDLAPLLPDRTHRPPAPPVGVGAGDHGDHG